MTRNPFSLLVIGGIKLYQTLLSPWIGNQCRFHPTCSAYSLQCFQKHGFLAAIVLSIRRITSCHPWSKRNWTDPVPERFAWRDIIRYNRNTPNQHNNELNERRPDL